MPVKESVKKAQDKYYENIKRININADKSVYELFINYCEQMNISKKELFERAVTEYIDKH